MKLHSNDEPVRGYHGLANGWAWTQVAFICLCLRFVIEASEPVHIETLGDLIDAFRSYSLREAAGFLGLQFLIAVGIGVFITCATLFWRALLEFKDEIPDAYARLTAPTLPDSLKKETPLCTSMKRFVTHTHAIADLDYQHQLWLGLLAGLDAVGLYLVRDPYHPKQWPSIHLTVEQMATIAEHLRCHREKYLWGKRLEGDDSFERRLTQHYLRAAFSLGYRLKDTQRPDPAEIAAALAKAFPEPTHETR